MKENIKKIVVLMLMLIIIAVLVVGYLLLNKETKQNNKKSIKEPEIIEKEEEKKLSLVMIGDVLIHESVFKDAYLGDNKYDFTDMFEYIPDLIKDYDLKYCNQESIIGGKELGIKGYPGFNAPDEIGLNLIDIGFNMFGLANNHALDNGKTAIKYSNSFWRNQKNVITAGTYDSKEERDNIPVYEQNGIKYAFLSYTTSVNGYNLTQSDSYMINLYSDELAKQDIENIKEKVDVIIVAMHWGTEYTNTPTNSQKEIAKYLSSLGVNVIIGTHPHVVQPIDYIDDTLVIYSLGNFISNQLVLGENMAIGLMVGIEITLEDEKVNIEINKEELLYAYSEKSTNFKVVPFSKMNEEYLKDYKVVEEKYKSIIKSEVTYD